MSLVPFTSTTKDELHALIERMLKENKVPGTSLTLRNGSDFINIVAGEAKTGRAMDDLTYNYGASLTKPLFAFVVHRLAENDVLDLSKPIAQQAELDHYDHLPFYTEITPNHVLSHSSGLPNWGWNRPLTQDNKPGTQFEYSGEGFLLLQKAVEQLTGKSFWDLLKELLMRPAGITRMCLDSSDLLDDNFIEGHDKEGLEFVRPNHKQDEVTKARIDVQYNAAGSVWTQPEAYARALHHIQTQHPQIWKAMQTETMVYDEWKISWGLGIGIQQTQLGKALWQWGSEAPFKDFTITFLDHDVAIHIFTNGANGKRVYQEILEILLGSLPNYLVHGSSSK